MYTVVRFVAGTACSDETLRNLGSDLNVVSPGSFSRLDHRGRRFSVSASSADDWEAHVNEVLAFVRKVASVIADGRAQDISVVADIAVESEDLDGKVYLSYGVPLPVLVEFTQIGVAITFTFYGV